MFGSQKSIAKTMVRSYLVYRRNYPQLPKKEILRKTLESRYPPNSKYPITWDDVADICNDIRSLTVFIVSAETETLLNAGPGHMHRVITTVNKVIERYVPEDLQ